MNPTRAFSLSSRNKQPIFVKTTTVRKSVKLKEQADQLDTLFGEGLKQGTGLKDRESDKLYIRSFDVVINKGE